MATSLNLRCRSKAGVHAIQDLDTESTVLDLKVFILSLTGVDCGRQILKSGFPPSAITSDNSSLLKDAGIHHGDLIIVEELRGDKSSIPHSNPNANKLPNKRTASTSHSTENVTKKALKDELTIKRKVVPANNSCLFVSIDYCIQGTVNLRNAADMRKVVAEKIMSDSNKFSEALLGRPQKEYTEWIMKSESWGGGIELSILCDHYQVEIDVIDIQNTRIEKFGEEHSNRILLIYDGIHYDPLYEQAGSTKRTIFPSFDDDVLAEALRLAEVEKKNRQYTDAKNFKLTCLVCGKGLSGPNEANEHASETKHINFKER